MSLNDWQLEVDGLVIGAGTPYIITGIEGLGIPDVNSSDLPRPHRGGSFQGFDQVGARPITISMIVTGTDSLDCKANLDALASVWYLHQGEADRPMTVKLPGTVEKYVIGRPRRLAYDNLAHLKSRNVTVTAEYFSHLPAVYSSVEYSPVVNLPVQSGGQTFPQVFPLAFGSGESGVTEIVNAGNYTVSPVVRIYGQCVNPRIEHVDSGKIIDLATTINTGDWIDVDMDARTILLNGTASRRIALRGGSQFWDLLPGSQGVRFLADSYSGAYVTVTYRDSYIGV